MGNEVFLDSAKAERQAVIDTVRRIFGRLACYLAANDESFPRVCEKASVYLKSVIKRVDNIDVDYCEGALHFTEDNSTCRKHAWLELGGYDY
jgi:hypothetical protein